MVLQGYPRQRAGGASHARERLLLWGNPCSMGRSYFVLGFTQGFALQGDFMRLVDESVENGIRERRVVQVGVPVLGRKL